MLISFEVTGRVLVASGKAVVVVVSEMLVMADGVVLVASRVVSSMLTCEIVLVVSGVAERVLVV